MVVGTRTACSLLSCQEVGEQITLACWRGPSAQGDLPSIGKSCAYNPCSGNGRNRNEVLKGLTGKKFVTREVFV